MKYFTSLLFRRLFKKLDFHEKEEVKRAISELTAFFDSRIRSEGLGLKRLCGDIWEIRSSLKDRILFSFEKNEIFFLMVGDHDEIKKYLKSM